MILYISATGISPLKLLRRREDKIFECGNGCVDGGLRRCVLYDARKHKTEIGIADSVGCLASSCSRKYA